jgi:hypothetical protein
MIIFKKNRCEKYKNILKLNDKIHEMYIIKVGEWIFLNTSTFDVIYENKTLGKYNYLKNSKVYKKYIDNRYTDDRYINISIFTKDSLSSEEQKLFKNNDFWQ